jgi:hypothetical protein
MPAPIGKRDFIRFAAGLAAAVAAAKAHRGGSGEHKPVEPLKK